MQAEICLRVSQVHHPTYFFNAVYDDSEQMRTRVVLAGGKLFKRMLPGDLIASCAIFGFLYLEYLSGHLVSDFDIIHTIFQPEPADVYIILCDLKGEAQFLANGQCLRIECQIRNSYVFGIPKTE